MVALFRSSGHDIESLRTTVRSLRETTVPGLAAALSWRTRKVEKLLLEELTRPGTAMAYDPARRVVRWVPPTTTVWPPPAAVVAAPPPRPDLGPTLSAPPPVVTSGGLRSLCPSCHVNLAASASPSLSVCPKCGRLFNSLNETKARTPEPTPPISVNPVMAPAASPARSASPSSAASTSDRRSQELLAAYMTAKPIPCPRCRTSLRHRGLSEYGCPSCGEVVRFTNSSVTVGDAAPKGPPVPAR